MIGYLLDFGLILAVLTDSGYCFSYHSAEYRGYIFCALWHLILLDETEIFVIEMYILALITDFSFLFILTLAVCM